jgi:uncharacterized protein (TIGR00369 family)
MPVDATLTQWRAEEADVRSRLRGVAPLDRQEVASQSGMQVWTAILSGRLPMPPICESLDFVPVHMDHGIAVYQGTPRLRHYNPLGTVHGGWFCTLLDSAMGCAVHTTLAAGQGYTTLELKVNMVRALTDAVPLVRAEGRVIHVGKQVATAEANLVDAAGKLYGHATCTCLIFNLPSL